ncbi:Protein EARLY-RESPONSIVE TO DEHYDRATION 7, chloroplastic [Stylosanthes scabra]|uniref:Protein EARLY-RESPONSIVE TO DEHYDRATION 7, chloroplastic n=1 Tax=Stylosanthes scabra TaxID=79078 RepID=A0ABU6QA36_9FABA|nr:Protein EARLY-RESPONSIVE TO DEHYDRATION 7, chloroplastic [Stylosanthes scabra]
MDSVSQKPKPRNSLYPEVIDSNPESPSSFHKPNNQDKASLYPSLDVDDLNDLVQTLFPRSDASSDGSVHSPSAPPAATEEVLIRIPGAILNLIDTHYSVELASGDFSIIRLRQGDSAIAVYARVADEIQWPLAKDETAVKVDDSHYFFSFRPPKGSESDSDSDEEDRRKHGKDKNGSDLLSYGLTIASKGQEGLLRELDAVLQSCSNFSVQKVSESSKKKGEVLDGSLAQETSPKDLDSVKKKEMLEERSAAYWTTLAPNVEDYSGTAARMIAAGSGHVIKGILWCGDVTVERLKWGNEVMKQRMSPGSHAEVSPDTMKRIRRVKRVSKMTEKVANGFLSGVLKVSGFFASSLANSKAGKKFFSMLPGEVVLASLDGFNKVCDAVEVAGRNVMSTSSTVTTDFVNHRYGDQAAEATKEGLGAAGHALSAAWAAVKIRKALNPKSSLKPTSLAKSGIKAAAAEYKTKSSK